MASEISVDKMAPSTPQEEALAAEASETRSGASGMNKTARLALFGGLLLLLLWGIVNTISALGPAGTSAIGKDAPAFDMPYLNQEGRLTLESLKGKVVLLDFFATWCKPCKEEIPILVSLSRRYQDQDVVIVSVNVIEKEKAGFTIDKLKNFAQRFHIDYPLVIDYNDLASDAYQVQAFPTLVFIDKQGKIRDFAQGVRSEAMIASTIESLLQE